MAKIKGLKRSDKSKSIKTVANKTIQRKKKVPQTSPDKSTGFVNTAEQNGLFVKNLKENLPHVSCDQIESGVDCLLKFHEKTSTKTLFSEEQPIFLQIVSIRIPVCSNRQLRLRLKHSTLTDTSEVCLIVPDLKKGRKLDHEPTVEHYKDVLQSKNITSIKRIIPLREIKVEYSQYELKRRLSMQYDCFLAEARISGHLIHLLGKPFYNNGKFPIPVKMDTANLEQTIQKSLLQKSIALHSKGNTYTLQIGHSKMSVKELKENILSVADELSKKFPGGWDNIRSLHIKTQLSLAIPIYVTLKSSNNVMVPQIDPLRPKRYKHVKDELSTSLTAEVTVDPEGDIVIHR